MGKKKGRRKKRTPPKGWRASPQQVEAWLDKTEQQLMGERYKGAVQTAQQVLRHVPEDSRPGGEALRLLGNALAMLQDFEGSYKALSRALEVRPEDANTWYNRALSCQFTTRTGQALRDMERAIELESNPRSRRIYEKALASTQKIVDKQIALRGPGFTLDQLIEEQTRFQHGIKLMQAEKWAEAEAVFRGVIEMGAVPPQPWANLAGCLIMQEQYDEAEEALSRALEIEPGYELARRNLEILPYIREHGPSVMGNRIKAPFEGHEIKQSLTFVTD
jgi:tetratricopeptide (TPR) repeat protein